MAPIISKADRARVALGAAPEAIQANLVIARRRLAEAAEEVDWLAVLLARRTAEVAKGEWPPKMYCNFCHDQITGKVVTGSRAPLDRRWCSEECRDSEYGDIRSGRA
jgi:hypothetical protein